jgi:hypothetical protein
MTARCQRCGHREESYQTMAERMAEFYQTAAEPVISPPWQPALECGCPSCDPQQVCPAHEDQNQASTSWHYYEVDFDKAITRTCSRCDHTEGCDPGKLFTHETPWFSSPSCTCSPCMAPRRPTAWQRILDPDVEGTKPEGHHHLYSGLEIVHRYVYRACEECGHSQRALSRLDTSGDRLRIDATIAWGPDPECMCDECTEATDR